MNRISPFPQAGEAMTLREGEHDGLRMGKTSEVPLITQYLRVAFRWRWVIVASVAACLVAGLIITLLTTPLYTTTTMLEISRESDRVVKVEGVEREADTADMEFYQTQYGLLKSRALAEHVASSLQLQDDPTFFTLFGAKPRGNPVTGPGGRYGPYNREVRLRQAGEILLAHVSIDPVRSSRLVSVSFTSPDPQFSVKIANSWGQLFIESNLARRFDANAYARKFLEERLEQLRQKLEQSERQLVAYAGAQRIITVAPTTTGPNGQTSAGAERSIVADDLSALNQELANATADRIRAESRVGSGGANSVESLSSPALATLRQRRAEVASDYAKMLSQFEPAYPAAKAMASQLAALDRSIASEERRIGLTISDTYRQATARESELKGRVDSLKSGLLDLRRRSIQYNIFQRDVDTNRQLYDGLLQRYKEIGVAGGVGTNNVSIVDKADIPERPSSPRLLLNLMLAALAGLVIGVALSLALEQIDETISDPSDIEGAFGLPLLGTVPKLDGVDPVEAMADPKSPIVEAYLATQTNLQFSTDHGAPRVFSVTSTRPAEGKSTTSLALARSLARAGKRVILVDGDMRSPSVHHLAAINNDAGLSNYLAGNDDLGSLLRRASRFDLPVMTAGPPPPNAADLLTSERFPGLLTKLLEQFEHVVIDSPPVMGLADAPLIASKVDGTIYAVESRTIRRSLVRVAIDRLQNANGNVLGIVLTKFDSKRAHFGYGYDYGYGYGEDEK